MFDSDASILASDPSQLRNSMNGNIVLSYLDHFAGINSGFVSYTRQLGKHPYFAGVKYINYGTFIGADETGMKTGEFTGGDYAFMVGTARELIDSIFIIGGTIKGITSSLEGYSSWGLAADVSIGYFNRDKRLGASLIISNAGYQFSPYGQGERYPLPLNVRLGVSKELENAPIRFHLTYDHIEKFNITYFDSSSVAQVNSLTGEENEIKYPGFADRLGRHISIGAELYPIRNFIIRLGYNYRRRHEMVVATRPGVAGLSWGLGLNLKKFSLSYSRASYHLAGGTNHITLMLGLGKK